MIRLLPLLALPGFAACGGVVDQGKGSGHDRDIAANSADGSATSQTAAPPVDCRAGEDSIFSCKTGAGKRIAVCAADGGQVEYRYGAERPEIVLTGGEFASVPYSGGGEAQIQFTNGSTRYIIFSRMVRTNFTAGEPNEPAISDGVIVLRDGKAGAMQLCDDPDAVPIDYDAAVKHMTRQDELFIEQTAQADAATSGEE